MSACRGCGGPLPPNKAPGRKRIWCSRRCRTAQYGGRCEDCGAPTDGSNGRAKAPKVCAACWAARHTIPTEALIAAIREWADEHDGVPPTQMAWNPAHPHTTDAQRAEYATGRWPSYSTVENRFGSWNAGLIAAGYEPHMVRNMGETVLEEWAEAVRAGEALASIAARYNVQREAIHMRLNRHGMTVRRLRLEGRARAA